MNSATQKQINYIVALLKKERVTPEAIQLNVSNLSKTEASNIISQLISDSKRFINYYKDQIKLKEEFEKEQLEKASQDAQSHSNKVIYIVEPVWF